jgi:hypothetical protein
MEEEKFVIHCFGMKISPKSYADSLLQTDIKIARLINEPYYTIDQPPISLYVEFVNKTLRQGKEGDIQYAIQGIVGELAELMKELDPTIPTYDIETIRAEAGDVLWYLVLLISTQEEVFKNFKFRSICSSETYFEIRKMFHWIDKLCKYSNQHDLDDIGVWRPRENCISITVYLYEILDFLLCCTDLSLFELILYNRNKLEKRFKIESKPEAEVD